MFEVLVRTDVTWRLKYNFRLLTPKLRCYSLSPNTYGDNWRRVSKF